MLRLRAPQRFGGSCAATVHTFLPSRHRKNKGATPRPEAKQRTIDRPWPEQTRAAADRRPEPHSPRRGTARATAIECGASTRRLPLPNVFIAQRAAIWRRFRRFSRFQPAAWPFGRNVVSPKFSAATAAHATRDTGSVATAAHADPDSVRSVAVRRPR
eukprot:2291017-Prymnesium_polylepis.2